MDSFYAASRYDCLQACSAFAERGDKDLTPVVAGADHANDRRADRPRGREAGQRNRPGGDIG